MKLKSLLDTKPEGIQVLSKDQSEFLCYLLLAEARESTEDYPENLEELVATAPPTIRILWNRVSVVEGSPKPNFPLVCFLGFLCTTPGEAVQWAYTAVALGEKLGKDIVRLEDFALAFPHGVPTQEAVIANWDEQKCSERRDENPRASDNLLDDWENWVVESAPAEEVPA